MEGDREAFGDLYEADLVKHMAALAHHLTFEPLPHRYTPHPSLAFGKDIHDQRSPKRATYAVCGVRLEPANAPVRRGTGAADPIREGSRLTC